MNAAHLAIDLGASSGRAILGILSGDPLRLTLQETHRFEHVSVPTPTGPVWDLTGIWHNILDGLRKSVDWCEENQVELASVGVDTWGVDWVLLGPSGELLALPHCYRDPQNDAAMEAVLEKIGGFDRLFGRTGIQLMSFNSIFQVFARWEREPKLFEAADRLVFLPDLFHFWLSGEITTELSIASTSAMLDVRTQDWDRELLEEIGIPTKLFGSIIKPGTPIGGLRKELNEITGAKTGLPIIAPATHDTASAVAAVPATKENRWAYLSSGTWSLLGAELDAPNTSDAAREIPFTNELGLNGTVRFLKNISGLWIVQELRRELLAKGQQVDFAEMAKEARRSEAARTLINPNYGAFAAPGDMTNKIRDFARQSDQPIPDTTGRLVRCCLESLALSCGHTLSQLERVLDSSVDVLHVVGGGTQNHLLNEFLAEVNDGTLIVGPVEATAIGNLLVQAIGCGHVDNATTMRQIVDRSFPVEAVNAPGSLAEQKDRFSRICEIE